MTVLTNATRPIARHREALEGLHARWPGRLTFRVSLDHYDPEAHEEVRGEGNFRRTIENTRRLLEVGFKVIVTSTPIVYEENPITQDEAVAEYRKLFEGHDVEIKVLPSTLAMGAELTRRRGAAPPGVPQRAGDGGHAAGGLPVLERPVRPRRSAGTCGSIRARSSTTIRTSTWEARSRESFAPVPLAHHACYTFCFHGRGSCTDDTNIL